MRLLFASLLLNFVIKFCFGEVSAFTIHPTGQPIACYYDETKVDTALLLYPNQHEFNFGFEIELISSTNNSLLINFNDSTFWMNIGYLAVNTRNYDNQTALLYQEPTFNSKIVYEFIKPQTLLIFGIYNIISERSEFMTTFPMLNSEFQSDYLSIGNSFANKYESLGIKNYSKPVLFMPFRLQNVISQSQLKL